MKRLLITGIIVLVSVMSFVAGRSSKTETNIVATETETTNAESRECIAFDDIYKKDAYTSIITKDGNVYKIITNTEEVDHE